jgi:KipI family sensor histidine kinase inhibitor
MTTPRIAPLGDSIITVTLGEGMSEELSTLVVSQARAIENAELMGVTDVVPSYASLGVYYDPFTTGFADLHDRIETILSGDTRADIAIAEPRSHLIKVRYDGEDLDEVARQTGLTTEEVVRIHSGREYRVYVLGFVPGFAYLGTLDERLSLPRRASPRKQVPPGSVAIAELQTAVYPSATPGGWHLIGRTDVKLFDAGSETPSLFRVGDTVRFEP